MISKLYFRSLFMFKNKVILITGAASGLGLTLTKLLSKTEAKLLLVDNDPKKLKKAFDEVIKENNEIQYIVLDVTDYKHINLLNKKIEQSYKKLDILINSAGIIKEGYFKNISTDEFHNVMEVNYFGTINVIRSTLDYLKESNGTIINIASLAGLQGAFGYTAYCSSKFALVGFSSCLRHELASFNVTVKVACPSEFDSPMVDALDISRTAENSANVLMIHKYKVEFIAKKIIKNIYRNNFIIIPGTLAKIAVYMSLYFPRLTEKIVDRKIFSACNKQRIKHQNSQH